MIGEINFSNILAESVESENVFSNCDKLPKNPGNTKSTIDHTSVMWFSNGVPVTATETSLCNNFIFRVLFADGFLIF